MPALPSDQGPREYLRPRPAIDQTPLRAIQVLDQLRERPRLMHDSLRTEENYRSQPEATTSYLSTARLR